MIRTMLLALVFASSIAATPPGAGQPMEPSGQQQPAPPVPPASGPTTAATPMASPDPVMLAKAKTAFTQLQSGTVDRTTMNAAMNSALTDDKVATVKGALGSLGAPTSFVELRGGKNGSDTFATYLVTFADGTKLGFAFEVDAQGKIAGMRILPPQQ